MSGSQVELVHGHCWKLLGKCQEQICRQHVFSPGVIALAHFPQQKSEVVSSDAEQVTIRRIAGELLGKIYSDASCQFELLSGVRRLSHCPEEKSQVVVAVPKILAVLRLLRELLGEFLANRPRLFVRSTGLLVPAADYEETAQVFPATR